MTSLVQQQMPQQQQQQREEQERHPEWDILLIACQKNQPSIVQQLLNEDGVSPNHCNAIQQSALHVASLWSHYECMKLLLIAGAIPNATNTITGATPLHCCVQSTKPYINTITNNGSEVSTTSTQEQQLQKIKCVQLLLEYGANLEWTDYQGQIPIDYWDERYDSIELKEILEGSSSGSGGQNTTNNNLPEIFLLLQELKQYPKKSRMNTTTNEDDDHDQQQQLESIRQRITNLIHQSGDGGATATATTDPTAATTSASTTTTTDVSLPPTTPTSPPTSILQTRHLGLTPLLQLIQDICCEDEEDGADNNDKDDENNNNNNNNNNHIAFQILKYQTDIVQEMLNSGLSSPNELPLTPKSSMSTNNGMFGLTNPNPNTTTTTTWGLLEQQQVQQGQNETSSSSDSSPIHLICQALIEEVTYPKSTNVIELPSLLSIPNTTTTTTSPFFVTSTCRFQLLWNIGYLLMKYGAIVPTCTKELIFTIARGGRTWKRNDLTLYLIQFWFSILHISPNYTNRQGMTSLQFAARSGKEFLVEYLLVVWTNNNNNNNSGSSSRMNKDDNDGGDNTNDDTDDTDLDKEYLNPCQADHRGQTPLDAAKVNGHEGIVALLQPYYNE